MTRAVHRFVFADATAVVTGAGSGLGEALAHGLARRGSRLVLLDRRPDRLAGVTAQLRASHPGVAVDPHVVDLADRAATARTTAAVVAAHPRIGLLVNNAGVALQGRFDELGPGDVERVLAVNLGAVVAVTHALLPALRATPGSHLVTVSSVFGIVAPPGQTAYAASKAAVRGFTDALRAELLPAGVGVTCVLPGGIATNVARDALVGSGVPAARAAVERAAADRFLRMPPSAAAETVLRAVERRRPRVLVGRDARAADLATRLFPTGATRAVAFGSRVLERRTRPR